MHENTLIEYRKGISGSTLKIIAMISMIIDHIGAIVIAKYCTMSVYFDNRYDKMYSLSRSVGRLAFPIFCFLLVEGFEKTGNRKKYALRLTLFTLISEPCFDLAFSGNLIYTGNQNVMFTLLIPFLALWAVEESDKYQMDKVLKIILKIAIMALGACVCLLIKSDYSWAGALAIYVLYIYRNDRLAAMFLANVILIIALGPSEVYALLSIIPVMFYNNKRGLKIKYLFYLFYPAHLFILYLIVINLKFY